MGITAREEEPNRAEAQTNGSIFLLITDEVRMCNHQKYDSAPIPSCVNNRGPLANQQGIYFIFSAITILVLFGIVALGIEVGRWYAIQSEISKSVDGAAFAGAANSGSLTGDALKTMVTEVAKANFPVGMISTENLDITVTDDGKGKITVDASVDAVNSLASVMGAAHQKTKVESKGVAKLRKFEIALVLDQSGSMSGAMGDLKTAARAFVQSFKSMESDPLNQMALVTFASGVQKRFPLTDAYVSVLDSAIANLGVGGYTNAEEALDRVQDDGTEGTDMGWSNQIGVSPNERTGQYVIFFSDGQPTAFRAPFSTNGSAPVEAAVRFSGSKPLSLRELDKQDSSLSVGGDSGEPVPSGTGVGNGPRYTTTCTGSLTRNSWKWWILDPTYDQAIDEFGLGSNPFSVSEPLIYNQPNPVYSLGHEDCIPRQTLRNYGDLVAQQMAVDHASEIKNVKEYQIYTVGLGSVDKAFLSQIASSPEHEFFANSSTDLSAVFSEIAHSIKLVLIE